MMRRRLVLCSALCALPVCAFGASPRPTFPKDGRFHWWNPGGDQYTGTVEQALAAFQRKGQIPADVVAELLRNVRAGLHSPATIRDGELFDYMMSGKDKVEERVVVELFWWPAHISRQMRVYVAIRGSEIFELCLPFACGNWMFRRYRVGTQLECVPCVECRRQKN